MARFEQRQINRPAVRFTPTPLIRNLISATGVVPGFNSSSILPTPHSAYLFSVLNTKPTAVAIIFCFRVPYSGTEINVGANGLQVSFEIARVLKKGGVYLLTDYRDPERVQELFERAEWEGGTLS